MNLECDVITISLTGFVPWGLILLHTQSHSRSHTRENGADVPFKEKYAIMCISDGDILEPSHKSSTQYIHIEDRL